MIKWWKRRRDLRVQVLEIQLADEKDHNAALRDEIAALRRQNAELGADRRLDSAIKDWLQAYGFNR